MASSLRLFNPVQPIMTRSAITCHMTMIMQVRAHSLDDQGRSSSSSSRRNMVDSNSSVLREKMELVKMRERLDKLCLHSPNQNRHGWNYATGDQLRRARTREVSSLFNLISLVSLTFGFTCFTAVSGLFLVSMIVHYLNQ